MNTTISIAVIFSLVAVISQIFSIWNAHKKNQAESERKEIDLQKSIMKFDLKLDNLNQTLAAVVENDRQRSNELQDVSKLLAKYDEKFKTLFSRVESIEKELMKHD